MCWFSLGGHVLMWYGDCHRPSKNHNNKKHVWWKSLPLARSLNSRAMRWKGLLLPFSKLELMGGIRTTSNAIGTDRWVTWTMITEWLGSSGYHLDNFPKRSKQKSFWVPTISCQQRHLFLGSMCHYGNLVMKDGRKFPRVLPMCVCLLYILLVGALNQMSNFFVLILLGHSQEHAVYYPWRHYTLASGTWPLAGNSREKNQALLEPSAWCGIWTCWHFPPGNTPPFVDLGWCC